MGTKDGEYKHDKRSDQTVIVVTGGDWVSTVVDKDGKQRPVLNSDLDDNRKEV